MRLELTPRVSVTGYQPGSLPGRSRRPDHLSTLYHGPRAAEHLKTAATDASRTKIKTVVLVARGPRSTMYTRIYKDDEQHHVVHEPRITVLGAHLETRESPRREPLARVRAELRGRGARSTRRGPMIKSAANPSVFQEMIICNRLNYTLSLNITPITAITLLLDLIKRLLINGV